MLTMARPHAVAFLRALAAAWLVDTAIAQGWEFVGEGYCNGEDEKYPNLQVHGSIENESLCKEHCANQTMCAGFHYCKVEGSKRTESAQTDAEVGLEAFKMVLTLMAGDRFCTLWGTGLSEGNRPGSDWSLIRATGTTNNCVQAIAVSDFACRCWRKIGQWVGTFGPVPQHTVSMSPAGNATISSNETTTTATYDYSDEVCLSDSTHGQGAAANETTSSGGTSSGITAAAVCVPIVLLCGIVAALVWRRRTHPATEGGKADAMADAGVSIELNGLESDDTFADVIHELTAAGVLARPEVPAAADNDANTTEAAGSAQAQATAAATLEIPRKLPRDAVKLVAKIGAGAFGEVHKAVLDEGTIGGVHIPAYTVAAKTCLASNVDAVKEMRHEAVLMAQVPTHPHVVGLIGVVSTGTPKLLVMAHCEHGSLEAFLRRRAASGLADRLRTPAHRLLAVTDIARGMEHLAANNIVHRDLACRNVLVDSELRMKVADFGLSRRARTSKLKAGAKETYYATTKTGGFPVRHTAPEAWMSGRYTHATDVWSFGVTMMEVYTDAELPYLGMDNAEVLQRVPEGYRMSMPARCTANIYNIMLDCWMAAADHRPTFSAVIQLLEDAVPVPVPDADVWAMAPTAQTGEADAVLVPSGLPLQSPRGALGSGLADADADANNGEHYTTLTDGVRKDSLAMRQAQQAARHKATGSAPPVQTSPAAALANGYVERRPRKLPSAGISAGPRVVLGQALHPPGAVMPYGVTRVLDGAGSTTAAVGVGVAVQRSISQSAPNGAQPGNTVPVPGERAAPTGGSQGPGGAGKLQQQTAERSDLGESFNSVISEPPQLYRVKETYHVRPAVYEPMGTATIPPGYVPPTLPVEPKNKHIQVWGGQLDGSDDADEYDAHMGGSGGARHSHGARSSVGGTQGTSGEEGTVSVVGIEGGGGSTSAAKGGMPPRRTSSLAASHVGRSSSASIAVRTPSEADVDFVGQGRGGDGTSVIRLKQKSQSSNV